MNKKDKEIIIITIISIPLTLGFIIGVGMFTNPNHAQGVIDLSNSISSYDNRTGDITLINGTVVKSEFLINNEVKP